jgi:hypothetical protein
MPQTKKKQQQATKPYRIYSPDRPEEFLRPNKGLAIIAWLNATGDWPEARWFMDWTDEEGYMFNEPHVFTIGEYTPVPGSTTKAGSGSIEFIV